MSIDFTGITGVSDDYGVVTQIADAQGNVLWSAVKHPVITITGDAFNGKRAYLVIDGVYYYNTAENIATLRLPIGTQIICSAGAGNYMNYYYGGSIKVNGENMLNAANNNYMRSYTYTVIGNATIKLTEYQVQYTVAGEVAITET